MNFYKSLKSFQPVPQSAQVVIEILIAVAVAATVIGSAVLVVFGGQSLSVKGAQESRALHFAQAQVEDARREAQDDFASLSTSSSTEAGYTKELIVEEQSADTKKVISRVSWEGMLGNNQQVELVALFTNWQLAEDTGGDTGGGGLSGEWKNPTTLDTVDLGPGNEAIGVDVVGGIVYIVGEASDEKKDDFFVIDATDGDNVSVVASTSTGPGLNAVDATSEFAYVANRDPSVQLQVIDVRNSENPSVYAEFSLPGVSGVDGHSLFYFDERVYVGTQVASGSEFHVVDVSDPANPTSLGDFEVGADVNQITVRGDYAYLATSNNAEEVVVLNVADPEAIVQEGEYDAAGSADALSVHRSGSRLYVGREKAASESFLILSLEDQVAPAFLGAKEVEGSVNAIHVRDYLAFVGTDAANEELQIYNIDDPEDVQFWSSFNFPQQARDIDYEDNLVYVAVRSNDALRIVTSQ